MFLMAVALPFKTRLLSSSQEKLSDSSSRKRLPSLRTSLLRTEVLMEDGVSSGVGALIVIDDTMDASGWISLFGM